MDRRLLVLVLLFFLIAGAFSTSIFYQVSNREIRASRREPSASQSLCIGAPLTQQVGQPVSVSCTVRDEQQNPVANVSCCFAVTGGTPAQNCVDTNDVGLGQTTIMATNPGIVSTDCTVNNTLPIGSVSFQFQ